ncbi:MAG: glycosyltransferase [Gammaproteobacteria bacterium]
MSIRQAYWRVRESLARFADVWSVRLQDCAAQIAFLGRFWWRTRRHRSQPAEGQIGDRSILIVSYYFPPYRSVYGTQRISKFAKFLSRRGWNITVLSTTPEPDQIIDDQEIERESIAIVRLPQATIRSDLKNRGMFVPDDYFQWESVAAETAVRLIKEKQISLVLSTAPPYTNLVVGTLAARKTGLPHIVDFRDPWSRIDFAWVIRSPILVRANRWMERMVLQLADRIVSVVDAQYLESFLGDDSVEVREKTRVITNGFDDEDFSFPEMQWESRDKFVVSYVGSIYDRETFDNILGALEAWKRRHPEDLNRVKFSYAGGGSHYLTSVGNFPCEIIDSGYVSHRSAVELRRHSHLQIFSQPRSFAKFVYSGKIFEMIRTGPPILAFTHIDGAVAQLLGRAQAGIAVAPGAMEDGAIALKSYFDRWLSGEPLVSADLGVISQYSRSALSATLERECQELISEPMTRSAG